MNKWIAFLMIASIGLTGCGPSSGVVLPESVRVAPPTSYGTVIASIGTGGEEVATGRGVIYSLVGSSESGMLKFSNGGMFGGDTPEDFSYANGGAGAVVMAQLPPGEYQLINVYFFENYGQMGTKTFQAQEPFSIKFTVPEGGVVYLGEFLGHRLVAKNMFYINISVGGYFVVTDRLERDLELLAKRGAVFHREHVTNITQQVLSAGVRILRSEVVKQ